MLNEPLTDSSPFAVNGRTFFGVLSALGVMALTAMVFWDRVQTNNSVG